MTLSYMLIRFSDEYCKSSIKGLEREAGGGGGAFLKIVAFEGRGVGGLNRERA